MGKRILLVEGPDDEHVLKRLCGNRGVPTRGADVSENKERGVQS
jgi:5S rRNA maturation endonuclease (ribonuclease M5)